MNVPTVDRIRQLMQSGQYAGALEAFHQLEQCGATTPDITYGKGICLAALGRTTEAKAAVLQLKELGNVAMAQRLAQRIAQEDPMQTDTAIAPVSPYPRAESGSPVVRYVAGAAAAVLLLFTGMAIGLNLQRPKLDSVVAQAETSSTASSNVPSRDTRPPDAPPKEAVATDPPSTEVSMDLTGSWRTVDYVRNIDDFRPGRRATQIDLFLKGLQCNADGAIKLECPWPAPFVWGSGVIRDNKSGVRAGYFVKAIDGATYLFFPWLSGDVTERGRKPEYYVLEKTSEFSANGGDAPAVMPAASASTSDFRTIVPIDHVNPYDDVRWKDMQSLHLSANPNLPMTFTFNYDSVWPPPTALPPDFDPETLLTAAKNPGLGVRQLHGEGITGNGVNVAIIDQPLFDDHPEFRGKIAAYHDVGCESDNSMHGPAVASLLVGSDCGTAPGAQLYYVAAPSWKTDAAFYADALTWLIDLNDRLPQDRKIRVVSVSAAPSGNGSMFANGALWDNACALAESKEMLVLDCTEHRGLIGPGYYSAEAPDDVTQCASGFPGMPGRAGSNRILVPCSLRTVAEEYARGEYAYQYTGRGGLSWSIPYCAGVLALGWQLRPDLTKEQMLDLLFQSAYRDQAGNQFINPPAFIERVRAI